MKLISIIFLFNFLKCYSQNKFPKENYVFGVIKTCVEDSSSFFNKDTIIIELGERDVNMDCTNRPKFSTCCAPWPTYVSFSFDDKTVSILTNKTLNRKKNSDIIESLSSIPRFGNFKLTNKDKLITIIFSQYKWDKKFKIKYDKPKQLLILIKEN